VLARETGEQRWWVCDHADRRTCTALLAAHVPAGHTPLSTDEWQRDRGRRPCHATVRHGVHEWARDADGDGRREGHGNSGEGAGAALRTSLHAFRGVQKRDLHLSVATDEAMVNTPQVTPTLIQRMCVHDLSTYSGYT
jgi:hypothetical protein